jgi:hypothetical protein
VALTAAAANGLCHCVRSALALGHDTNRTMLAIATRRGSVLEARVDESAMEAPWQSAVGLFQLGPNEAEQNESRGGQGI